VLAHLMDSVEPQVLIDAEEAALSVRGVEHAHLRGRWLGRTLIVEVEAFIPSGTRIDDAERLGIDVRAAILRAVPECRAVVWSPHALPSAT
jgi:divalent metal cation (Fe/Co/Zn/Cd) transporter